MIVHHQDIVDGKSWDHVDTFVGITAVEKSVRSLRPGKFPDRFAGQPVVPGYRIGVKDLQSGVLHILQLLIIGAVHIGLMHAAAEGPQADIPDRGQCLIGRGDLRSHFQRIAGLQIGKGVQRKRFFICLNRHFDKAESSEPEGLQTGFAFRTCLYPKMISAFSVLLNGKLITISLQMPVYVVSPVRFSVFHLIAFAVKKHDPGTFSS